MRFTQTKIVNGFFDASPDYWWSGTFSIRKDNTANLFMRNTNYDYTFTQKGNEVVFLEKGTNLAIHYSIRYSNDTILVLDNYTVSKGEMMFKTFQLYKPKN